MARSREVMPLATVDPSVFEDDVRLFHCCWCRRLTKICRRCDRGHRYCSKSCSTSGRAASVRAARQRYARSQRGRLLHAARQRRWRQRQASPSGELGGSSGTTAPLGDTVYAPAQSPDWSAVACDLCGRQCSGFARHEFLTVIRHGSPRRRYMLWRRSRPPPRSPTPRPGFRAFR